MSVAVITGSLGLIGAEAALYFADLGLDIVGIDNDMRYQEQARVGDPIWWISRYPEGQQEPTPR